jgi:osmoprotectant transport system ATP-binding protein
MAVLAAVAARRHAFLVVALFLERAIRDPAGVVARSLSRLLVGGLIRAIGIAGVGLRIASDGLRGLFRRLTIGDALATAVLWHELALRATVANAMPVSAIEFRGVSFARPGGARVLDQFSLTVEAGDVLALVGRSGAGKSTLLKLINRLLEADEGAILVEGRDTREWEPIQLRRRVGYVLQDVGLFPHMSVAENVAVVPRLERWTPERVDLRVHELLDLVGLPAQQFATRWPDELSGGQRQRVGVARALAIDPPVLLMDEPFGALDPLTRAELHREFRRIQARLRKTVIIVTHDMGEAFALADRVGVLDEGRLVACDRPEAVVRSTHPRVRQLLDALPVMPR